MQTETTQLDDICRIRGLLVTAVAPLTEEDGFDARFQSVALLSPDPDAFWTAFCQSPELRDGGSDPIDRWSQRTILALAEEAGGQAVFPFDGPPYRPFSSWAQRAGVAWQSPSGMLVHAMHGLWISFRAAVALPTPVDRPTNAVSPCETCPQPCLQACPVQAVTSDGFDYPSCRSHVRSHHGATCAASGCLARRACPVGRDLIPPDPQLAMHMRAFAG
ncbi:MAG: ferredoxin [Pseudomonadota bacterium]